MAGFNVRAAALCGDRMTVMAGTRLNLLGVTEFSLLADRLPNTINTYYEFRHI
jgi:hypothetical protein